MSGPGRPIRSLLLAETELPDHALLQPANANLTSPVAGSKRVARFEGPSPQVLTELGDKIRSPVPVFANSVGNWAIEELYRRGGGKVDPATYLAHAGLPALADLLTRNFRFGGLQYIRLFTVDTSGYARPHRDWPENAPEFSRYHIPIFTNSGCASSEDDTIYRMTPGEIWYLDGSKPHSAIGKWKRRRVHVVLDFDPQTDILAPLKFPSPTHHRANLPKRGGVLGDDKMAAIEALSALVTGRNSVHLLDALGALHFDYQVSSSAVYDWLEGFVGACGDPLVRLRADQLRDAYLY